MGVDVQCGAIGANDDVVPVGVVQSRAVLGGVILVGTVDPDRRL